jgi:hypothetical protein
MNNMLTTDPTVDPAPKAPPLPPLETAAANPRMRHIPALEWIIRKIDVDVRARIGKLTPAFTSLGADNPHKAAIDAQMRQVSRTLDRLAETARHGRGNGAPSEPVAHLQWSLEHALAALKSLDANLFGRRNPYHVFEKSRGELLWGAALSVLFGVEQLVPLVRAVDPGLDERLLEGLVVLQNPVDERMLKPIA